jgi:hypothetical protein
MCRCCGCSCCERVCPSSFINSHSLYFYFPYPAILWYSPLARSISCLCIELHMRVMDGEYGENEFYEVIAWCQVVQLYVFRALRDGGLGIFKL